MKSIIFITLFLLSQTAGAVCDTLVLDESACRRMALEYSHDVRIGKIKSEQAGHQSKEVLANFFPSIKGSATGVYIPEQELFSLGQGDGSMAFDFAMKGTYLAGFTLTQPVFAGGKIVNAYALAKKGEDVARLQERLDRAEAAFKAVSGYWSYVAVRSKVRMLEEYSCSLDSTMVQVEASLANGMATNADFLKVQTARRTVAYQLEKARTGAELCRMSLSNMLGIDFDTQYVVPVDESVGTVSGVLPEYGIEARPEVQMLQKQVQIRTLQRKMTVGDYLPTLGFMAGYTWFGNLDLSMNANNVTSIFGMIPLPFPLNGKYTHTTKMNLPVMMLSLSIPITDWGKGVHAIKRSRLEEQVAKTELEKNSSLMNLQLRQARMNMDNGWSQVQSSSLALDSAAEQLRVVRDRYEVGLCTMTDLLSAQADWQKAFSDKIEAGAQYKISEADYLLSAGVLE